ncbi:MAG TPA: DNA replication/repair protein RecF [Geminicoccaceae bacterium]|nr:DNA replication/repair protein RecF [Geminicoccus sp.]HMU52683.1 DNA replication/repair protein RecF [Geminicoccaceae bacterium]
MPAAVALSPQLDPARPLAVARLSLQDFRNYARLSLDTGGRPVVLHGANGAGKTNLLEAVSLLAPGRGLRQARLPDLDRRGGGHWSVRALVEGRDGPAEVWTGRAAEGERRGLSFDGQAVRSSQALADTLSLIWLTPAMDRLFMDGAGERRRFLDRLVLAVDSGHGRRVSLYERTLRERSVLLRGGRADPTWLGALERRAAEAGVAIAAARRELLAGLETMLAGLSLPFPRPRLELVDDTATQLGRLPAVEVEQRLAAGLVAGRADDAHAGGASVGPHRADLDAFDRDGGEPARLASTGRQKAYLLSIVLAEASLRRALHDDVPVLLLDEVAAHLDERRRHGLFDLLDDLGCQFWLTGTDRSIFLPLAARARLFTVCEATLTADD